MTLIAEIEITQGNIDNDHFRLNDAMYRFPTDLIGEPNEASMAPREAEIDWGGPTTATTDIESGHKFFRRRGWVREFFHLTHARPGDRVLVHEIAPYHYKVSLRKA